MVRCEDVAEAAQPLAAALLELWESGLMGQGKPKEECTEAELRARRVYSLVHAAEKRLAKVVASPAPS